jgi:hypothetical protein
MMAVMWTDEDSSLADRRRWDRFSPDGQTSVTLAAGGRTYDCELLDLSLGGARLRVGEPMPDDDNVVLQHRVGGLFFASATWRRGDEIGVRFRVPEQTREHALQCASVLLYGDDEPGILPPVESRSESAQAQS